MCRPPSLLGNIQVTVSDENDHVRYTAAAVVIRLTDVRGTKQRSKSLGPRPFNSFGGSSREEKYLMEGVEIGAMRRVMERNRSFTLYMPFRLTSWCLAIIALLSALLTLNCGGGTPLARFDRVFISFNGTGEFPNEAT